jgi:hypothetical protein
MMRFHRYKIGIGFGLSWVFITFNLCRFGLVAVVSNIGKRHGELWCLTPLSIQRNIQIIKI